MTTRRSRASAAADAGGGSADGASGVADRRRLRSQYLAVKNVISDDRDEICKGDSDRFLEIFNHVEKLHQSVDRPREQVADAEALLDFTNTFVTSVRSLSSDGITPSDFVSSLMKKFGQQPVINSESSQEATCSLRWGELGSAVANLFMLAPGCSTMVGPLNMEVKQQKIVVRQRRERKPAVISRPKELDTEEEQKTDTDRNMAAMFSILRKNKHVRLENLILNRASFAQTVENVFALSFLVKDGRVEIDVDESGNHIVSPRNAPPASAISSGEVSCTQFVFRFDYKDWMVMKDVVNDGDELMPHRSGMISNVTTACGDALVCGGGGDEEEDAGRRTPIRKLSRNRGFVAQEDSIVDETPDSKISVKRSRLF